MSIGYTIKKSAMITGGTLAVGVGLAGYGAYRAGKFVRGLLYPPTVKKYIALAALPVVLYSIKHPTTVVEGTSNAFRRTGAYASDAVGKLNDARVDALRKQRESDLKIMERLESEKKGLEGILKKEKVALNQLHQPSLAGSKAVIYVDKKKNELYLYKSDGSQFKLVASYYCTTGINPLPKRFGGDRASPEGVFYAVPEEKKLDERFTNLRMNLLIPKSIGSGIMVTGTYDPDLLKSIREHKGASNGGIILEASDYIALAGKLPINVGIPIVISGESSGSLLHLIRGGN